jgi:hypothetical protein
MSKDLRFSFLYLYLISLLVSTVRPKKILASSPPMWYLSADIEAKEAFFRYSLL